MYVNAPILAGNRSFQSVISRVIVSAHINVINNYNGLFIQNLNKKLILKKKKL